LVSIERLYINFTGLAKAAVAGATCMVAEEMPSAVTFALINSIKNTGVKCDASVSRETYRTVIEVIELLD
jgi:hypothetical protein